MKLEAASATGRIKPSIAASNPLSEVFVVMVGYSAATPRGDAI